MTELVVEYHVPLYITSLSVESKIINLTDVTHYQCLYIQAVVSFVYAEERERASG